MALINCPECNNRISDKANSCPHCGYPFEGTNTQEIKQEIKQKIKQDTETYTITLTYIDTKRNHYEKTIEYLSNTKGIDIKSAFQLVRNLPCVIYDSISHSSMQEIRQTLSSYDCELGVRMNKNSTINKETDNMISSYIATRDTFSPKCPTCDSTNIKDISSLNRAVHGYAFGLFSKTARSQFECLNCGYKW